VQKSSFLLYNFVSTNDELPDYFTIGSIRFQVLCLAFSFTYTGNPVLEKPLKTLTVTGRGVETIPTTLTNVHLGLKFKTAQEVAVGGTKVIM